MESTGARLKNLRLEKGLSLEEVRKKTKIHLNILKAIEEDSLLGLSPVYIKGFLKIYCQFLGVDPKEYIKGYAETPSPVKEVWDTLGKPRSFFKSVSLKLSSLRPLNIKMKTVFIIISIPFLLIALFTLGKSISSRRNYKTKQTKLDRTQRPATLSKKQESTTITPAQKKETSARIRLGIRAKEDCWVHLKVDGRVVFHTVLKKGKFESWQAADRIELSLGNAGVIELELNSKPIPALGRRGQAIKNILITKEAGLVVPR